MLLEAANRPNIGIVSWDEVRNEGHFKEYSALFVSSPSVLGLDNFPNVNIKNNLSLDKKLWILENFIQTNRVDHIFFEWGHDLIAEWRQIDSSLSRLEVTFSTLASLTDLIDSENQNPNITPRLNAAKIWNMALSSKNCTGLVTWDPRVKELNTSKFTIALLPDYQESTITPPEISLLPKHLHHTKTLGFFGQLFAYRGLEALIQIANSNPNIKICAIGKIKYLNSKRSFKNSEKKMWEEFKKLKNVLCIDQYVIDSQELNFYISEMDAIFLDTKNYTVPSGIVTRARNIGTTVLITSANSAVATIYQKDPNVITIDSFNELEKVISRNKTTSKVTTKREFQKTFLEIMKEFNHR